MRITGIELIPITIRFRKTIGESFGEVGKREDDVIVQLFTDEGITGLGEAMTLGPFYSGESQGTVMAIISEVIAPKILLGEDPFNIDKIHFEMDRLVTGNSIAKAAMDFALHDIAARKLGIPIYQLLGGRYTDRIPLRWAVGISDLGGMVAEAERGVEAGYKCLKIKIGDDDTDLDFRRVEAVRKAVGPKIGITLDANQAYTPAEAIRIIRRLEPLDILSVEQPVPRHDILGLAEVRKAVDTPIGACESAMTIYDVAQIIRHDAADFLNFKVSRSGGFYRGKQIVNMAHAAGIACVGSTQLGMGIELAANAHFAVSTSSLGRPPYTCHGYGSGLLKLANATDTLGMDVDIVTQTPRIEGGYLFVPEGPGLGVELNPKAVEGYLTEGKAPILIGSKEG